MIAGFNITACDHLAFLHHSRRSDAESLLERSPRTINAEPLMRALNRREGEKSQEWVLLQTDNFIVCRSDRVYPTAAKRQELHGPHQHVRRLFISFATDHSVESRLHRTGRD